MLSLDYSSKAIDEGAPSPTVGLRVWSDADDIVCLARFDGHLGPPAIIPSRLFPRLEMLLGDVGARSIVTSRGESVREVDLPRAAFDIDHPEDLARLRDQRAVREVLRNGIADLASKGVMARTSLP